MGHARGAGAFFDGVELELPAEAELEILGVESARPELVAAAGEALAATRANRMRMIGSIALSLCHVASARFDALVSLRPCRSVDAAAGQLLVREAGGLAAFPDTADGEVGRLADARHALARGRRAGRGGARAARRAGAPARRGRRPFHAQAAQGRLLRPGDHAPAARARLRVPRRGRQPDRRSRGDRADRRARHPAGLEGRLGLPVPDGPHPGHRRRRPRAQAVPLPPQVARAARPGEVRLDARLRPGACRRCAGGWPKHLAEPDV